MTSIWKDFLRVDYFQIFLLINSKYQTNNEGKVLQSCKAPVFFKEEINASYIPNPSRWFQEDDGNGNLSLASVCTATAPVGKAVELKPLIFFFF